MWKLFFGVQDPRKATPSRKTHPNWKVDPFLGWMQQVFRDAWHFGKFGSCDKQDIGFTGKHQDKQRINYKDEGDGFLTDSIADRGTPTGSSSATKLALVRFILLMIQKNLLKRCCSGMK